MSAADEIDAIITGLGDWRGERMAQLRAWILRADPDVEESIRWRKPTKPEGVPVWSRDGIICTGESYMDKLKLTFPKGSSIDDPTGLFNAGLSGTRHAIDVHEGDAIDEAAFVELVRAAIAVNAG